MDTVTRERFEVRVDRSSGPDACHPWTGGRTKKGYGKLWVGGKHVRANRVALEAKLGRALRPEMGALHTCDNPPCCNERHLYEGTQKQNIADAKARGRLASGDRNGARLFPERRRYARGDQNGMRRHPERRAVGMANGKAKLDEAAVRDIRSQKATRAAYAERYGVSKIYVGLIQRGTRR